MKGLCGNYNDNQIDDFQTPYGGIPEVSALLFGDSWKLQPHCAQPSTIRVSYTFFKLKLIQYSKFPNVNCLITWI